MDEAKHPPPGEIARPANEGARGDGIGAMRHALVAGLWAATALSSGWLAPLWWPAMAQALTAVAHLSGNSRLLGKRSNGRQSLLPAAVLLPRSAFLRLVLACKRRVMCLRWSAEVAPGVFLGARPNARDLPACSVLVDLCAELPAARSALATVAAYHSLPVLDGGAPTLAETMRMLNALDGERRPIYIACRAGVGRSAAFASALLMASGIATGPDDATRLVRARRPAVRLSRTQLRLLRELGQLVPTRPAD